MRLVPLFGLAAIAACGSFGTSSEPPAVVDGGTDAGADSVTSPAPPDDGDPCPPQADFIKDEPVAGLEKGSVPGMLSADELTIFVHYGVTAETDLFFATRESRNAAFGPRNELPMFASQNIEREGAISPDGLTFVFARDTGGAADLYRASRTDSSQPFSNVTKLETSVNSGSEEAAPYLTQGALYFSRGAGAALFRVSRAPDGSFASPVEELTELRPPTDVEQTHPVVTPDDQVIYFASRRTDRGVLTGELDVFTASKNPANEFGDIHPVKGVSSPGIDLPTFISPDNCRLYFFRIAGGTREARVASRR